MFQISEWFWDSLPWANCSWHQLVLGVRTQLWDSGAASAAQPSGRICGQPKWSAEDHWELCTTTRKTQKMTYPLRVICGTVKPSLGLLAIQGRARQKSLGAAGVLPTTQNPLTAATATESGLLDCTILLLEGIRVHTTWPLSGCARATGSACVRPTNGRLPQSAFSFELHSQRIDCTSHRSFKIHK